MKQEFIDRIGKKTTLEQEDKIFLVNLANWLYDNGWYAKANYIYQLVENCAVNAK